MPAITPFSNIPSIADQANFESEVNDFLTVQLPRFAEEANAAALAMNMNDTSDTSASSVLIGTGAKSFTVTAGKSFLGGMFLVIADTAAPSTNWMIGQVTSYAGTALVMNITAVGGSGTKSAWTISQCAVGIAGGAVAAGAGANADITSLSALTSVPLNLDLPLINGYVEWSISANALTAAIKHKSGADPSASAPVFATFRDSTLATAGFYSRAITAATSVTASSGSTLGTVSAQASRIRAVAVDDGGTVVLGLYNSWNNSTKHLLGLNEGAVYSSTAEGGAGAADSAHTIYTTAAKTSKAIREVSYMDSTQTTAGTWAQTLTNKVQITATTPKTGTVLQVAYNADGAVATGTTTVPIDDTVHQNSEGDQFMSQAITPQAAANLLHVTHQGNYASSNATASAFIVSLFQDSVAGALATTYNARVATAGALCNALLSHFMVAGTVSATTMKIRGGLSAAGTTTFNGQSSARLFGGVMASFLRIQEVMA
jgi:hypothetical protein